VTFSSDMRILGCITTIVFLGVVSLSRIESACAKEPNGRGDYHAVEGGKPSNAPIKITINPEARVSVSRGGDLPLPSKCGAPIDLPVDVVNFGSITAPLEATLIYPSTDEVRIQFTAERLTGTLEERRFLRVTLLVHSMLDVTIAFRAKSDAHDLGGRDRIHLILHCLG
jgi:hypothetical protein